MITALDTNIFLDILLPNEKFCDLAAAAVESASAAGLIVICDVVYAELCAHFATQKDCDNFLSANNVRVESLTRSALFAASRAWRLYRLQGGKRTRVLADFLIGAHAKAQASRLLSRDRGFYETLFPGLKLVDPSR
ncbi:MAG: type II toxin-antitoxin system VapC family toxin [Acidobacteriota bacterium]|nr:type II toxin-antitoxin system VapC family toxin [Acidobacteriota bacterium]